MMPFRINNPNWPALLMIPLIVWGSMYITRHNTMEIIGFWAVAVFLWVWLIRSCPARLKPGGVFLFFGIALCLRLIAFVAFPALSDDIYRFIWDGQLILQGTHPFSLTPQAYMHITPNPGQTLETLYPLLNSPEYFTVYPAACQAVFYLAARLFPDDIYTAHLIIKLPLLLAEILNLGIIYLLVSQLKTGMNRLVAYAFQPFIILEGVGNAHFEVLLLTPLLLLLLIGFRRRAWLAALLFSTGIAIKILPAMLLPAWFFNLPLKGKIVLGLTVFAATAIIHLPLFTPYTLYGMYTGLSLYYSHFEFNASVYYLLRNAVWVFTGYNPIAWLGPVLAITATVLILALSFKARIRTSADMAVVWIMALTVYWLLATTVHPWYLLTIAGLSVITSMRFPFVWLCLAWLSYVGYTAEGFEENLLILVLQYAGLFVCLLLDLKSGVWSNIFLSGKVENLVSEQKQK